MFLEFCLGTLKLIKQFVPKIIRDELRNLVSFVRTLYILNFITAIVNYWAWEWARYTT